jgi:hypothetical protein
LIDVVRPVLWSALYLLIVWIDYAAGPAVYFPIAFALPVGPIAWHHGRTPGLATAAAFVAARAALASIWGMSAADRAVNTLINLAVLALLAWLADRAGRLTREVRVLRGILRICAPCKRIAEHDGVWVQMESYVTRHSEALFSMP